MSVRNALFHHFFLCCKEKHILAKKKYQEKWEKVESSEIFAHLFSGQDLPDPLRGPAMTTTAKGDGLIMTNRKGIYRFKCVSSESCFFEKDDNELHIDRIYHHLLTVPTSLVEDCWNVHWKFPSITKFVFIMLFFKKCNKANIYLNCFVDTNWHFPSSQPN